MADNALVTPLVFSSERAINERAQNKLQSTPRFIPVTVVAISGEMVTVKAEMQGNYTIPQITIPQAYSAWIREPTQVGDKGFAVSTDYYLGGQSGLGGGTANFRGRSNLTSLVFMPVSQKTFAVLPSRNLNAALIAGPQGAVIQDQNGNSIVTVSDTKICLNPKTTSIMIYVGGDGSTGSYAPLVTTSGPCLPNIVGRYA